MDLDANAILASFLIGCVGFGVFLYGKRQARAPQIVVGILLMVYPYFVSNVFVMLGVAAVLLGALWLVVRLGA